MRRSERPPKRTARELGSPLGMKLLAFFARVLPRRIVYWIALLPVAWYYLTRPEGRRSSAVYQEKLGLRHGPVRRFLFGLGQARAYSEVILDNLYLGLFGPDRIALSLIGTERFLDALAEGKGLILLSAHVGNWHLATNFLGNTRTRVHLVTDEVRQDEVRRQMDLAKQQADHLTVHGAGEGVDRVFALRAALGRGEVVILAGDRQMGSRKVRARFLGSPAWFPATGCHLARISGAPVCMAFAFRTGMQRYDFHGVGPFRVAGGASPKGSGSPDEAAGIEQTVQRFAEELERFVRRFPAQWFNFFDFWAD